MVSFTFGHRVLLLTNRYSAPGSGNDASVGGLDYRITGVYVLCNGGERSLR